VDGTDNNDGIKDYVASMRSEISVSNLDTIKGQVARIYTQVTDSSGTYLKEYVDEIYAEVASPTGENTVKNRVGDIHSLFTGTGQLKA